MKKKFHFKEMIYDFIAYAKTSFKEFVEFMEENTIAAIWISVLIFILVFEIVTSISFEVFNIEIESAVGIGLSITIGLYAIIYLIHIIKNAIKKYYY